MVKKANPRRYARAVFEIARENNEYDKWLSDLQKLVLAVDNVPFREALESPRLTTRDKTGLLVSTLGGINPLAMNLALLLISRSSIGAVGEIAVEYKRMFDAYRGVQTADVITAVPLDEPEIKTLKDRLSALTGAKIEINTDVDPGILGGVVARVDGKLLDGSTKSKLAALKRNLVGRG